MLNIERTHISLAVLSLILTIPFVFLLQNNLNFPTTPPQQYIELERIDNSTFLLDVIANENEGKLIATGRSLTNRSVSIYLSNFDLSEKTEISVQDMQVTELIACSQDFSYVLSANSSSKFLISQISNELGKVIWTFDLQHTISNLINVSLYSVISNSYQLRDDGLLVAFAYRTDKSDFLLMLQIKFDGSLGLHNSQEYTRGTFEENSALISDAGSLLFLAGTSDIRLNSRIYLEINEGLIPSQPKVHSFSDNQTTPIGSILSFFPLSFVKNASLFIKLEEGHFDYTAIFSEKVMSASHEFRSQGIPPASFSAISSAGPLPIASFQTLSERYIFIPLVDADTEFPSVYNFANKTKQLVGLFIDLVDEDMEFIELDLPLHEDGIEFYGPKRAVKFASGVYLVSQAFIYDPQPLSFQRAKGTAVISFNFASFLSNEQIQTISILSILTFIISALTYTIIIRMYRMVRKEPIRTDLYP